MGFKELRQSTPLEEFDYQLLISHLEEYSNKRDAITRLLRQEKILRIKKGLYIFGADYRKGLVCKEALANQIYGPSYISFEYALAFYGMIPERVEVVTSATSARSRKFHTPIAAFFYRHLPIEKYKVGTILHQLDSSHSILIATVEKALLDQVYTTRGISDIRAYLLEDLRIEEASLKTLSLASLREIASHLSNARVDRTVKFIEDLHRG